jgi:Domain of unknown function (DUF6438)
MYTVTIRGDGQVQWWGSRYVAVKGSAKARVSRAAVARLRLGVANARVFRLKSRYDQGTITDLPSATVTVRVGQRIKRIYHYHGDLRAPKRLFTLECLVDRIAGSRRWVGRSTAGMCRQFR